MLYDTVQYQSIRYYCLLYYPVLQSIIICYSIVQHSIVEWTLSYHVRIYFMYMTAYDTIAYYSYDYVIG